MYDIRVNYFLEKFPNWSDHYFCKHKSYLERPNAVPSLYSPEFDLRPSTQSSDDTRCVLYYSLTWPCPLQPHLSFPYYSFRKSSILNIPNHYWPTTFTLSPYSIPTEVQRPSSLNTTDSLETQLGYYDTFGLSVDLYYRYRPLFWNLGNHFPFSILAPSSMLKDEVPLVPLILLPPTSQHPHLLLTSVSSLFRLTFCFWHCFLSW